MGAERRGRCVISVRRKSAICDAPVPHSVCWIDITLALLDRGEQSAVYMRNEERGLDGWAFSGCPRFHKVNPE